MRVFRTSHVKSNFHDYRDSDYFVFHLRSFESFPVPVNTEFQDYRDSISKFARAFLIQRQAKQAARHMPARAIQSRRPVDAHAPNLLKPTRQQSGCHFVSRECSLGPSWKQLGSKGCPDVSPQADMASIGRLGVGALLCRAGVC